MEKPPGKPRLNNAAVYLRLENDLVAWLDQEARRQRRSRAFVVGQACRLLRAVRLEWQKEENDEH